MSRVGRAISEDLSKNQDDEIYNLSLKRKDVCLFEVQIGINVGEMNAILLKKVEELTLYAIALRQENTELKSVWIKSRTNKKIVIAASGILLEKYKRLTNQ